jgi:hypothetical protein
MEEYSLCGWEIFEMGINKIHGDDYDMILDPIGRNR